MNKTILTGLCALLVAAAEARAQTTAFTYQGRLMDGTNVANGNYDLRFYLRDALTAGNPVGTTNTISPVAVSSGLFTVTLNFGAGIFTGAARWLELGVRTNGSVAAYATLSPRQPLTPSPYAIYASGVSAAGINGTVPAANLDPTIGLWTLFGANIYRDSGNVGIGTTTPRGPLEVNTGAGSIIFRNEDGFAPGITISNSPNEGVLRLRHRFEVWPNPSATEFGSLDVRDTNGAVNVRLPGRGDGYFTAGNFGIGTSAPQEKLHVAGQFLRVDGLANEQAYLGGNGFNNDVQLGSLNPAVTDVSLWNAASSTAMNLGADRITANEMDLIGTRGLTVNGDVGIGTITPQQKLSVAGGVNLDQAGANNGSIASGLRFGSFSGEGIGSKRTAGGNQFGLDFYTAGFNRLSILNDGKVGIGTTNPPSKFTVVGGAVGGFVNPLVYIENTNASGNSGPALRIKGAGNPLDGVLNVSSHGVGFIARFGNANAWVSSLDTNGNWCGTSFNPCSDRNVKENFAPVDAMDVLEKVAALPISTWNYKQDIGRKHIGPMAQDFWAAFGAGMDDKHIATVDADGVALAAIQGLNEVVKEKDTEIRDLKTRLAALETLVNKLAQE